MHTESPHGRTLDESDAREARRRERFAHLALITPSPDLIREVIALETDAPSERAAVIDIVPGLEVVTADR